MVSRIIIYFFKSLFTFKIHITGANSCYSLLFFFFCTFFVANPGNHDFDFGIDILNKLVEETNFPWLLSNVFDKKTGQPLAHGLETRVIEVNSIKIGLIGLVEFEWMSTLACIEMDEITYVDFVEVGRRLADKLRKEDGVDIVIALTHMRVPNDTRLAEEAPEIDLILGKMG